MWLFNAPPLKQLKEKYQFEPSPQWLEHLQKASVRFNSGGSGSFVSPNGLVITNHHVGADTLQKMGSVEHNYLRDGFYAKTQADEIKSTDLELNVLISIEDVTPRVTSALKPGMTSDQARGQNLAIVKTTQAAFERVRDAIQELHSYDVPECVGVSIDEGGVAIDPAGAADEPGHEVAHLVCGIGQEIPVGEMARRFDLATVSHSAAVFDTQKLAFLEIYFGQQLSSRDANGPAITWPSSMTRPALT